ncbi:AAEL005727-PA [Aedes aegypti]|uniref:AAEL005727-PA n=1 Tax=Aedes aegypti TaxID=7159 RepID=Q0IFD2_AEDAE|nr:AAEL005727-PA [Aedes aegypti]
MDGCSRYSSPYAYLHQMNLQEHPTTPLDFVPPPFSIEEFNFYHHHYQSHFDYDKPALYNPTNASSFNGIEATVTVTKVPKQETSVDGTIDDQSLDSRDREREKPDRPKAAPRSVKQDDVEKKLTSKALSRARHTLQQRLKRQNETPEQKAIRRQRNAELNRRRRMNKEDIRVAMEKVKNRLRQRIKREIDRMLRTRQKREDFLRETFEQMSTVFSDSDMMQYQGRIANALQEISD